MLGDHDSAVAHAQEALAAARESGDAVAIGLAQDNVGVAWEHRGDGQRAAEAYAEAVPLLQDAGAHALAARAQADWADKLVWLGDLDAAVPMLDAALDRLRVAGPDWGVAMALGQRGHAALRQDDPLLAAHLFTQSIDVGREVGYERAVIGAIAGLAGVALALGQPERAARLLGAVDAARMVIGGGRIAHALHAERIAAEAQQRLSEPAFATAWNEGRTIPYADAVAEAIAISRSTAALPQPLPNHATSLGLTPRERDVLRLLVEGRSDREIGEVLFIGTRTVQTHVANLFAKLAVNARAEAAAVAVRRGLV
jgi:non-specific serine/threonine protein kinase